MPDHTQKELELFNGFAAICPIGINLQSIEKRQPPEPDIFCCADDGTELFFELVEVVDSGLATVNSQQIRLQRELADRASSDEVLKEVMKDALIAVAFRRDLSLRKRRNSVPAISQILADLPIGFEGDVDLADFVTTAGITRLHVSRGDFAGPAFHVDGVTSFCDPTLDTIFCKLHRQYSVSGPLYLLAYFALQPMDAGTEWKPGFEAQIRRCVGESSFRAVWLFEQGSGKLMEIRSA